MKLVDLLNEVRYKTKLIQLNNRKKKPKAIIAFRIERVEKGGSKDERKVTTKELIDIFRSTDFPPRYRTSNYVYQVEIKKSKNNKQKAIVNIFNADNLPDDIDLNEPADFDLNGAKVYLMTPDAVRFKGTSTVPKIGDKKLQKMPQRGFVKMSSNTNTNTKNTTTTTTVPTGTPLLKRGSRGESVKQLQTLLGLTGESIDGKFGAETAAWLSVWQDEHNLTVDGIYGPKTAAAMKKDLSPVKDQERAKRLTNKLRARADKEKVGADKEKVGAGINIFKRLESKYPKVFRGSYTFKLSGGKEGKTVKRLSIGSPSQAETYEAAMKKNITAPGLNTDEALLLDIFSKLSKSELTTLFKRYQQINGTSLAKDLKDDAFDEGEMAKLENIFLKKGLNLASFMRSGAGASF